MSVDHASFLLEPKKNGSYALQVNFMSAGKLATSSKEFTFTPYQGELSGELVDYYSQNGVCSPDILNHLFSKGDEQGIKKAASKLKPLAGKVPTILVLDLKDPQSGYKPNLEGTVAKCEEVVCAFFKKPQPGVSKHARKAQALVAPDFVLCEGSLKIDLLAKGGFSPAEVDYFNSPNGVTSFCQCAEFFMNAFKFGQEAHGPNGDFLAGKYIVPISGKAEFKPYAKSVVFYPALYKEVYSPQGAFAQVLSTAFQIEGMFDAPSKITTLTMQVK
jgi:hypothetical protein